MFCLSAWELQSGFLEPCPAERWGAASCSAQVREGQLPQQRWGGSRCCASGYKCILKGNPAAMPIASPAKPSVGVEGKVRYVWGKPNWRKGRKQEVISNFLMVHIFQWLSNGHLPIYVNTSLCTCRRDSYSIDAVWLFFFISPSLPPHGCSTEGASFKLDWIYFSENKGVLTLRWIWYLISEGICQMLQGCLDERRHSCKADFVS